PLPSNEQYGTEFIKSKMTCEPMIYHLWMLYAGPLILIWLVIPVSAWSISWVSKGFKTDR
ncbi:MAG TPA: hypothetical protein VN151_12720, partial [Terracidiphilus sp.]|nr:hypothetical protein [Terracidiphilus sp.]